jgi:hypothetical protein
MAIALRNLATLPVRNGAITILSSNPLALQALNRPKHQLGQWNIRQIYKSARKLRDRGNQIFTIWALAVVWLESRGDAISVDLSPETNNRCRG